ncbi:tumor necrosis factor receptor superfamily member 5-like [Cyclopterus lumpus]|uniref:tumor necrosis factor receptor superfamily member 5-like n=1 Tax=Cyclopterus lumpus TaxID=8103 RepID=UPI0014870A93|nr:tumor necrosis factor receptor superfamily member 5-like [Cyclopterus lumpus]XP_034388748.1 tumor necrosis factor receptor superfamily member 5-like [Cyclopterus lumpus]XP_034388749.1 tumor necrosis factor receptor superfamily member 5-like [Cyclopterus lumpus]
MVPQSLSLAVMCVLSLWTIAAGCGVRQEKVDGQCCDLCLPGTYRKGFCPKQPTDCSPCEEGYFSDNYTVFDRCNECRVCQQDYVEKCTPTTNAKCKCHLDFLCSDNVCSKCEENKCVMGEKLKRTDSAVVDRLIQYSYTCEPQSSCPYNTYFDVKEGICKADKEGIDFIHLILAIGFVLLSLTLLVFLSNAFIKKLRKHTEFNNPMEVLAVSTKASDFCLSKEESGFELIVQDESKNINSLGFLHL